MTAGIIEGTNFALYMGGLKIGLLTANSVKINRNIRPTANKDSGIWGTNAVGRISWTMDCSMLMAFDTTNVSVDDIIDSLIAGTAVTLLQSTQVSGDMYLTGSGIIGDVSLEASDDDNSTYSCTFTGTGALTKAYVT